MAKKLVEERGRDQLLGYLLNERQSQDATREWIIIWLDTWCPIDPALVKRVMAQVRAKEPKARRAKQ